MKKSIKDYLTNNIGSLFSHYSKTIFLSLPLTMYSGLSYAQEVPNILLILVDDLGVGDLAVNGNLFIKTPNIDSLAGEAIFYKDFYVNALCAPSRASLLTGRDFWKTGVSGVHGGRDYVNLDEVMFPELLQQAGYVTGMWGKWHSGKTDGYFPWDRGFDEAYYATLYNHFNNVGLLNGKRVETKGWATDRITDFAIDFIKRNSEKKFFAYVSYMAPHEPWYAPEEYTEKYTGIGLSKPLSTLYGMVEQVDSNVGRLLKTLKETGIDKSTVVIFLSDNGPTQYCSRFGKLSDEDWGLRNPQGLRGAKGDIWDNGVKSPLYIKWEGKTVPHIQYGICSITDIFPTILNFAGIDATKINVSLDGEDLNPLEPDSFRTENRIIFRSKDNPKFPEEFAQNGVRNLPYYPIDNKIKESLSAVDQTISVRDDTFKLVQQDSNNFLFDMFLDPRETSAINDKEDITEKLKNQLQPWFDEVKNEPHAFGGPIHQIGLAGREQTKIYACSPSEISSGLDNHGHYLANWKNDGDYAIYKIKVCTPGKYQINLVYRIQPLHEYEFTVSAGSDRISRSIIKIEKDAWFDTLFEQESAYGGMNAIGNAKIGIIQLDKDTNELKIELNKVLRKQEPQADFQLLTINFTRIDNVSFAQIPFPPDRFPVIVNGTLLNINDCSGRRFFLAGMVDNEPNSGCQLSLYNHDEMETQIMNHKAHGATAMRWNTFLFGKDLRWDANGYVTGMCDNAVANIKDGLDLAYEHGIVIQIVLSTAHFLSYGSAGQTPEQVTRVNNNKFMFENTVATQAYIDNVIKPITQTIGVHPGLFGYCIINEASGMYFTKDAGTGTWSDVKVHMSSFQKFVNLVASEIHTNQPGALCSVSGIAFGLYQYTDAILIAAGGKTNGTLDINQLQFYPENHKEDWSPFTHTIQQLVTAYGGELKPLICGESPIEGNPTFGLEEGLVKLWDMGNNGYFTWSYNVYDGMTTAEKAVVDAAYTDFYAAYLVNNDFNGSQCPNHLYVTPVSQTVPVSAGSTDLIIISDKSWSASSDATWCSLSPSSGSNNDTISVVRTANTGAGRTANITLSASGVPNYIVSVYQEGDYLHISPLSKNVGHTAGVVNLTVSSNLSNWTASSDAGWCTVSPSSGSNNGVVTATYTENTGAERTANIIFPVSGAPDVVVTITQALIGVFQQSTGSDKLVSVEAEHFNRNRDGTGDFSTHIWIETTSPSGYSGNSAMITNPNNSTNASDVGVAEDYAPLLEYGVNFVTTGTHYIWLLVCTNGSSGDNSFHSGLDGSISAANLNLGTSQSWVWKELLNGGARATIDVTSTGAHTFGIFMREDGARVDKFVLTTNIDYVPAGTGPTESKQVDIDLFSVLHTDKNQYSLSIYPNPSSGNAHLNFGSNKVEDVEINISNLVGQQLISKSFESVPLTNGIDLALQSLKNGIYLIQCKMEGHTQSIRFIKN